MNKFLIAMMVIVAVLISPALAQTTGSLYIEYPTNAVWEEGLQKFVYPFVFESDSAWAVDVCAYVPQGYKIVNQPCQQTFLNAGELRSILFEVNKVGSPPEWVFHARLKARGPHGSKTLDLDVPSIVKAAEKKKERASLRSELCRRFGLLC